MSHTHHHHDHDSKFFIPQDCGYSDKAVRLAENPINFGRMDNAHGVAENTGTCGESLAIYFTVDDDGIIDAIQFYTEGCIATRACGCAATILATHRSLDYAAKICERDMLEFLEQFPDDHHHCIMLAVGALHDAVASARHSAAEPGA
jgi:NifU-like protein involved in Fe-S cluster formation